jgi:hypothetical protein
VHGGNRDGNDDDNGEEEELEYTAGARRSNGQYDGGRAGPSRARDDDAMVLDG